MSLSFGLRNLNKISRFPPLSLPIASISTVNPQWANSQAIQNTTARPRVYLLNQYREESVEFEVAIAALRAYSVFQRPETVEIILGCNMKHKKDKFRQPFRGNVTFPHSFGTQQRVLVFAEESLVQDAYDAGADVAGGKELIDKVLKGLESFDVCLCTPSMLNDVKKLQNVLRAKMPTTRRGTVVEEFIEPIRNLKNSREYHCDKRGFVFSPVAKLDYPNDKILANIKSLAARVMDHRQTTLAKNFVQSVKISSTYGPGLFVNVDEIIDPTL